MHRTITASELAQTIGTEAEPFVLDVRDRDEHTAWRIPGATNIPVAELADRLDEIPKSRPVVVHCAAGGRSLQAYQILEPSGFDVVDLEGGMGSWAKVYDTAELTAGGATVVQVRRRAKGCLSYVVGSCGEAYVVDPSLEVEVYEGIAADHDWKIVGVFDTHLHADHLSGARLLARRSGATLYLNPADTFDFDYEPLTDEQVFTLPCGTDLGVSVLHTPGHTEGSTIFRVGDDAILTGDTLFVDGVGRPDLADRAEEFAHNLYTSLHERVLSLGDQARVLPSHVGEDVDIRPGEIVTATVGDLRRELRPLALDEDAFVSWAAAAATDRPPNYVEIIHANMGRPRVDADELRDLELGPNRCSLPA
ncbi:MBL fold metallo-hydrolase [Actinospongicola halichondriae]|uniref:MBL fold metallo-hydrolase n=1 Tax=Actinospongicola halichondriae TaxID=3236844 RepID=UPI003D48413C